MKLWPHQVEAIRLVGEEAKRGKRAICLVMPTGAGKSLTGGAFCVRHLTKKPDGKVLWCAHRDELVSQAYDQLTELGLSCGVIQANPSRPVNPHRPVQVASTQTLLARGMMPEATMLILDECFPAGTRVGGRPIESYREGDLVESFDHDLGAVEHRSVLHIFKSVPTGLVRVNGVVCTPNHPFFVPGEGYVEASRLEGCWTMRRLRRDVCAGSQDLQSCVSEQDAFADDDVDEREAQPTRVPSRADAGRPEPDARSGLSGSSDGDASPDRAQALGSRRQWNGTDSSAASSAVALRGVGGTRVRGCDGEPEDPGPTDLLQDRHRLSSVQTGGGDRRGLSRCEVEAGARCQEGSLLVLERVDRVEVLEPGSDGTYGGMCPDSHVYNLEVDGNHNYFVEGVLVHNCHHYASKEWSKLALEYRKRGAFIIGLTATPQRSDGRGLGDIEDENV